MKHLPRYCWSIVLAGLLTGCSPLSIPSLGDQAGTDAAKDKTPGSVAVKVDGQGVPLRDGQIATTKSSELLPMVQKLTEQHRARSLRAVLQQRPDMALEVLRDSL